VHVVHRVSCTKIECWKSNHDSLARCGRGKEKSRQLRSYIFVTVRMKKPMEANRSRQPSIRSCFVTGDLYNIACSRCWISEELKTRKRSCQAKKPHRHCVLWTSTLQRANISHPVHLFVLGQQGRAPNNNILPHAWNKSEASQRFSWTFRSYRRILGSKMQATTSHLASTLPLALAASSPPQGSLRQTACMAAHHMG